MRNLIKPIFRSLQDRQTLAAFASIFLMGMLVCYALSVYFDSASDLALLEGSGIDLAQRAHHRTVEFVVFSITVALSVGIWLCDVFWKQVKGARVFK